jgi:hypothetical protein
MNTPTPLVAWILDRLVYDRQPPLNGELADLPEEFRPLGDLLLSTPPEGRESAWKAFLAGRPDKDDIIKALADIDPLAPPPAPEAGPSTNDWPLLSLEELPPVDSFPIDVLPLAGQRLAVEGSDAIGCAVDFIALTMLAVAGGTIGRSVSLKLKPGYFAGATLFAGCVGPPSDGKTPALKAVAAGVRAIDDQLADEHARAMEQWRQDNSATGKKTKPPAAPKPRRIDIDDATMEVLPLILADNPRGLIMVRDELSAFVLGMNQFKGGKGNDRANALKIWSGDKITKDRVNHENNTPIRCAHPTLTIVGGLTPDMLGALTDPRGRADGFIDRFLLVYPDPLPVADWSYTGISDDLDDDWTGLITRLWMRPLDVAKDGRSVPHVAYFTVKGKARWEERYNEHSEEMNAGAFPPFLRGPWGKLREYAGRLALILTLMHHASDATADPLAVPEVDARRVDDAWKLIGYFQSHARRVHAAIAYGPVTGESRAVKAIVEWIRAGRLLTFTERELKQARRWIKGDMDDALAYLTERGAIRPRPALQAGSKGGRPPSTTYDVNPALLVTQNP